MPFSPPRAQLSQGKSAKLAAIGVTFLIVVTAFLSAIGPAKADTRLTVSHVWFDALEKPQYSAQARYRSFINSLRLAAGHGYRGNVDITQTDGADVGLIRVDVNMRPNGSGPAGLLRLWISPGNLYLRGFTTASGVTYETADRGTFNLQQTMNSLRNTQGGGLLPPANGEYRVLVHGGSYPSLEAASPHARDTLDVSYNRLWNHLWQLAFVQDARVGAEAGATAESFLFMTQFLSEAARFNDVFGIMNDIVSSPNARYNGMPWLHRSLENNWRPLSNFAIATTNNEHPRAVVVNSQLTITNWSGIARYLSTLLAPGNSG
ncbi:ribosome-inactivating family protein [Streptomyces sp. NPDC047841]|uniref:ribosome-inactivating family protein n=1 Tax=Streptomyces sp. NPDC047841 TaxID=3154708 RepID=UPI00345232E9